MIRSKSTTATSPTILLTGYSQVEVKFYFTAVGMESGKTFVLRYSSNNGTSWSTIATFTSAATVSGTNFKTDNGFYVATITMNSGSFNSTAKFRIQINGSSTTDIIYFDAVTIKGRTNTTGSGNVVTLAPATKTIALKSASVKEDFFENNGILLFPNPVVNTLNISSKEKINIVRILSLNGSVVSTTISHLENISMDVSKLAKGAYIVEIITNNNSIKNKIIKH
jgi:hypothetical protein